MTDLSCASAWPLSHKFAVFIALISPNSHAALYLPPHQVIMLALIDDEAGTAARDCSRGPEFVDMSTPGTVRFVPCCTVAVASIGCLTCSIFAGGQSTLQTEDVNRLID